MSHSHSQILALPVIPPTASARIQSMKEHFEQTGECAICQVTQDELTINESKHFKSVVPFAATFPFEIWIIPRHHSSHFHELDHDKVMSAFAMIYKWSFFALLVAAAFSYILDEGVISFFTIWNMAGNGSWWFVEAYAGEDGVAVEESAL